MTVPIAVLLASAIALAVDDPAGPSQDGPPCGPTALYILCQLEGMTYDLDTVEGRFQAAPPAGHSMEEIRLAGRTLGLDLQGIRSPSTGWSLNRPAIVFLDKGGHGHFVVIRPVGHSGHLVQVIDGSHAVETLDYSRLISTPSWTGLALIPARSRFDLRYLIPPVVLAVVFGWIVLRSSKK